MLEDLAAAPAAGLNPEIASEMVAGIVLRLGPLLASQESQAVEAAVAAILSAAGVEPSAAAALADEAAMLARAVIAAQGREPAARSCTAGKRPKIRPWPRPAGYYFLLL